MSEYEKKEKEYGAVFAVSGPGLFYKFVQLNFNSLKIFCSKNKFEICKQNVIIEI